MEKESKYNQFSDDLVQLAEAGDKDAQFLLGEMYRKGDGVTQDEAKARQWYHEAANQGHARAQYELGMMMCSSPDATPQDKRKAFLWFEKAALQDLPEAQYQLGQCYLQGLGVPVSDVTARQWFRRAASQGYADAEPFVTVDKAETEGHKRRRWLPLLGIAAALIVAAIVALLLLTRGKHEVTEATYYVDKQEVKYKPFTNAKGTYYFTGTLVDGKPNGIGEATFTGGDAKESYYKGNFVDGNMEGKDAHYIFRSKSDKTQDYDFYGTFKNNEFYEGKIVFHDGMYFVGKFVDEQPDEKNGKWYDASGKPIGEDSEDSEDTEQTNN